MSLNSIKLRINLAFLALALYGQAQNVPYDTAAFYNHLVKENLLPEQLAFSRQMQKIHKGNQLIMDSLYLNQALAFNKWGKTDSVSKSMMKISSPKGFSASTCNNYLSLLILTGQYDKISTVNGGTLICRNDAVESVKILMQQSTVQDTDSNSFSPPVYAIKNEYEHQPKHSGLLAGIYSMVIPGLGKWYLGYRQQAFSAFTENALLGGMAAESYFRAGLSSPRFIITGSLFALFYGGNIWGSAILAKKQKRDYMNQINYEILEHYNISVGKFAE
jgi:hypothetical protein